MLLDGDTLPAGQTFRSKIAVFGSGPAGLTVAKSLSDRGIDVFVAEGGGRDFDPRSQDLYWGEHVGNVEFDLMTSRLRMFGGTSNHWGGYCRPLDPVDFRPRPEYAHTGWPITADTLAPYGARASEILEVQAEFRDQTVGDLVFADYGFSQPPVHFSEKYTAEIEVSERLTLLLNASLYEFEVADGRVRQARLRGYDGQTWTVEADSFVMCLGGIENSRMLLWTNMRSGHRLVAAENLLGRFWMDHPNIFAGQLLLTDPRPDLFVKGPAFRTEPEAFVSLAPTLQDRLGASNTMFNIRLRPDSTGDLLKDLMCVAPRLGMALADMGGRFLICGAQVHAQVEQWPDPNNRVLLGTETDALGVPQAVLHQRFTAADNAAFLAALGGMGEAMAREGIGRLKLPDWAAEGDLPPQRLRESHYHHMGGTRMAASPEEGVVDPDCRVWGTENLYVGGSSVFPTGGYANPTYTIVELALRLADHLEDRLRTSP